METLGAGGEQPIERRREHVLPGVLLHVIETARPVDTPHDARTGCQRATLDDVQHVAPLVVDDVHDARGVQRAGIERLPSGGRVEGGAVQPDDLPAVGRPDVEHGRLELRRVAVSVVDAFSHESEQDRARPPRRTPWRGGGRNRSVRRRGHRRLDGSSCG
jgi:hypothetical protein